jgi:diadenosine tetraphosphate (Ap4A) HIT family hydrolase
LWHGAHRTNGVRGRSSRTYVAAAEEQAGGSALVDDVGLGWPSRLVLENPCGDGGGEGDGRVEAIQGEPDSGVAPAIGSVRGLRADDLDSRVLDGRLEVPLPFNDSAFGPMVDLHEQAADVDRHSEFLFRLSLRCSSSVLAVLDPAARNDPVETAVAASFDDGQPPVLRDEHTRPLPWHPQSLPGGGNAGAGPPRTEVPPGLRRGRIKGDHRDMSDHGRVRLDLDEYSQKSQTNPCFICQIVAGTHHFPHGEIYRDDRAIAFLNRFPTLYGYALVAPLQHVHGPVTDMAENEFLDLLRLVHRVGRAISAVVPTERMYVLSLGSEQGNAHIHWHLAPLPPGVPYEQQQQYNALMLEAQGYIDMSPEERQKLAQQIAAALA